MNTKTLTQEDLIVKTCRQECRENGIRKTTIKWASQVITNWNLMLEDGDINAHQPSELKAIIRENLTIRDSIIIASMTPSISVDKLTTLAAGNDAYSAQPNAISTWLEWLNGNTDNAQAHAIAALESDEECTLVCIAYAAINYGIRPAYLN